MYGYIFTYDVVFPNVLETTVLRMAIFRRGSVATPRKTSYLKSSSDKLFFSKTAPQFDHFPRRTTVFDGKSAKMP